MTSYACIDIGNVLMEFKGENFTSILWSEWANTIGLCFLAPPTGEEFQKTVKEAIFMNKIAPMQDLGLLGIKDFIKLDYPGIPHERLETLSEAWNDTLVLNQMMLNFLENLKSQDVKIALLSNMGKEHAEHIRQKYPEVFEGNLLHLSYEVGARKPSKLFFQSFLMDHAEFTGCVYLDDRDENLTAGKAYSFKSYKFDLDQVLTLSQSKQKLELDKIASYIMDRKYDKI